MTTHLTEDELILHYYGEADRDEAARITAHLASCAECERANQQLRRVMALVGSAAPVEAPEGFERTAWARVQSALDGGTAQRERGLRAFFGLPQWALAGGVAALVLAAFVAGRFTGGEPAAPAPGAGAMVAEITPDRVLQAEVGDHLDRTQMMLVELVNAGTDHTDVFAAEQARAADLVAVNRLIRQSVAQSGDAAVADVLEDLERLLLEIANAPADATSNELTDLQSRITTEDLVFRVRVVAQEMRQRMQSDRETGGRVPAKKMPVS